MQVADASSLRTGTFPGRAKPGQEVNLSFRVGGPLVELNVKIGDAVKQGDTLARIDPKDYESSVGALEGQQQSAEATATRAAADYRRIENTYKEDPGATSEMALDQARQTRDSAAANARGLRSSLNGAKDQLSYTYLQAPFDGEVVATYAENFETVIPKQPIVRIVDPSKIEFTISVAENQIGYAPYVTDARIIFDALPGTEIVAKITEISKEASQATRTYPVTLAIEQPEDGNILSGMSGEAIIQVALPEGTSGTGIQIPGTALFTEADPEKTLVWVIADETNTLVRREVQTGYITEFGVLIESGLRANEWIVVAGPSFLSEGEEVRILGAAQESTE
jgi:RND family efflux transporter MFP subunit